MLSTRQGVLALMMAAVGVLAWWVQREGQPEKPPPASAERRPDYTVENFAATMMSKNGIPDRKLSAPMLRHYPSDGSTELDQPVLTLLREDGPPWLIRSRTGWVSAGGDDVILRGDVRIDRAAGQGTRPVHLQTAKMHVRPREDYAETSTPVRVTSDDDWVASPSGAQAWLGEALRVKLLGRSHARVTVNAANPNDPPGTTNAEENR